MGQWVSYHLLINGGLIGIITHFLTFDPNFQRDSSTCFALLRPYFFRWPESVRSAFYNSITLPETNSSPLPGCA